MPQKYKIIIKYQWLEGQTNENSIISQPMSENPIYPKQKIFLFKPWAKDKRRISELWAKDKPTETKPLISVKLPKNSLFFYFLSQMQKSHFRFF